MKICKRILISAVLAGAGVAAYLYLKEPVSDMVKLFEETDEEID